MGGIGSLFSSESYNTQVANSTIAQNFSGICDISCENSISNVNMTYINSVVNGGINISQECTANAQCMIQSMMDATSDTSFAGSTNSGTMPGPLQSLQIDLSKTSSVQAIQNSASQNVSEVCKQRVTNSIDDVQLYAVNSEINGGIFIGQTGTSSGNCSLANSMQLANYVTGTATNCSTSGSKGKKSCSGTSWSYIIIAIVIIVILIIGFMIVSKFMTKKGTTTGTTPGGGLLKTATPPLLK